MENNNKNFTMINPSIKETQNDTAAEKKIEVPDLLETVSTQEEVESIQNSIRQHEYKGTEVLDAYLRLIIISRSVGLFHDKEKTSYIVIKQMNGAKVFRIKSKEFLAFVSADFFKLSGEAMKKTYKSAIIDTLDALAQIDGEEIGLQVRVAKRGDDIVYDLHDGKQSIVKINAKGWIVETNEIPLFKSYPHQREQVVPIEGQALDSLLELFNVAPEDRLLFLVSLVCSFIPNIPHPIMKIEGEKGSAKSTAVKMQKMIIDPSMIQSLSLPNKNKEMVQQLDHHYYIGYDNVSRIGKWTSDALCRAVTGDGYSCRTLYSDDDDTIRSFQRVISINGINLGALSDDLLDRCLIINLKRIDPSLRKSEALIWSRFDELLPGILGAIFTTMSEAMKIYPTVKLNKLSRLADFHTWGYAIAEAILGPGGGNKFLEDYGRMVKSQEESSLEDNVFLTALTSFAEGAKEWKGTAAQLYVSLEKVVDKMKLDKKSDSWPKAANYLSKNLRAYRALLKSKGITVDFAERTAKERLIYIKKD